MLCHLYPRLRGPLFHCSFLLLLLSAKVSFAQHPSCRIDLNIADRKDPEVNEPGYLSWKLPVSTVDTATFTMNAAPDAATGLKITLIRKGPYGNKLVSYWYKAGVQSPVLARLVDDGIKVNNGEAGAQIEMRISGLPAGRHTILTYHNNADNYPITDLAPLDVYVNGARKIHDLPQTVRNTVISATAMAYLEVDAVAGQDVVLLYMTDPGSKAAIKNFMINGIEINTPNPLYQARQPYPANADEHVDADHDTLTLRWSHAPDGKKSTLYLGADSSAVAKADKSSGSYKTSTADTSFRVSGTSSLLTWYWRVDEKDAAGHITKGNTWYYRPRHLAFKDAEGYGRFARGGRGGKVIHVTNLNDNGPGSLREAVTNDIGPRTIVFDVAGLITLNGRLAISSDDVTIAGQTAPGKGICLRKAPFGSSGNDVIIRFIRVRVGGPRTNDGMGALGNNSIVDHCSISWSMDEGFSSRNAKNITLQRTLISEALNVAGHQNYPPGTAHGYAATISGAIGSFHHNLLAHCEGRNWSMGGGLDGDGFYIGYLDIRNNVVYNWDKRTTDGGAHEVNFVNNYYKPGAASENFYALTAQHEGTGKGAQQVYFAGNVMPGHFDERHQQDGRRIAITRNEKVNYETFVDTPFFKSYVNTQSAKDAYKRVLSDVGNNEPRLDGHDLRIIHETLTGAYTYKGSVSGLPGLPDKEGDVGGWEDYPEVHRAKDWDSDNDGLPDWWEKIKGLNIHSPAGDLSDANGDPDKDGFTNLDDYLEWMSSPHYFTAPATALRVDLTALTRGYTDHPVYTVSNAVNGTVTVTADGKARFLPSAEGLASFDYTVTDKEGSSMSGSVKILANTSIALSLQPDPGD